MTDEDRNRSLSAERSGISMKLSIFACIFAFAMALLAFVTGLTTGWSGLGVFTLSVIPFAVAALFAAGGAIHAMLNGNAAEEEYEKAMLEKRKASVKTLLDVSEDVRFTAGRTLQNYSRFAPYVLSILAFLLIGGGLWFARSKVQELGAAGLPLPKEPLVLAFICVLGGAFALFAGVFLAGQSRMKEFRWLRPAGAWFAAAAGTLFFGAVPPVLQNYGHAGYEMAFSKIVFFLLIVLALELLFSLIAEFYRPRTRQQSRPVHESRILAVFIEPGSVARNLTDSLDYQFGFKISGTKLFSSFCHVALPALGAWLLILWIFTGIAEVGPGEIGLRTRFGKLQDSRPLSPGAYLKLPWPCDEIIRINVENPSTVLIGVGSTPDAAKEQKKPAETVLWTTQHTTGEMPFLVANDSSSEEIGNAVSLLNATLPVVYRANRGKILDFVRNFRDVSRYLTDMGMREATIYFSSTDFIRDMSTGRETISRELRNRIQKAADARNLGVEILAVNLIDTHPPVQDVAPAFQDVFCAQEEMGAEIEKARAYSVRTLAAASIETIQSVRSAEDYKFNVTQVSASEASQFRSQLAAYSVMPGMFRLRTYLGFLENDCADLRKYIVSASIPTQILELNAEEKPRLDLLDADLTGEIK